MRNKKTLLLPCIFIALYMRAQVGINILTPHPSAALHVETPAGSIRGLLTPSMTTTNRTSIITGTNVAADGLIVYDIGHRMHYYYQAAINRWVSMSPFVMTTLASISSASPSGIITTPFSPGNTFSLALNRQTASQVLDVIGSATVSGNITAGGNLSASGSLTVGGAMNITGNLVKSGYPVNALIPAGGIIMWSGSTAPAGWALCDGSSGTPDLRGRFIVGYDAGSSSSPSSLTGTATANVTNYGAPGNTGGENAHTLLLPEMPSHTHNVSAYMANGDYFGFSGPGNVSIGDGTAYGGDPITPVIGVSESSKGGNQVHENRPPYYVLAFIMKLP
jgi:microcystin-dependent protein